MSSLDDINPSKQLDKAKEKTVGQVTKITEDIEASTEKFNNIVNKTSEELQKSVDDTVEKIDDAFNALGNFFKKF